MRHTPRVVIGVPDAGGRRVAECHYCGEKSKPTAHGPLLEAWRREHNKAAMTSPLRVVRNDNEEKA